ncbi:hypothetical protein PPERSA_01630 [Pseudocohnilembus persalinus]|uniref:Tetratricopeptide repeat protein n=1 Tax=Pseudocohnilembus persalinus TaxID=266149 RepID=A0A0V0R4M0_PSEPJ|nr:hypothetical protein PPERSA_01630 [Pseudocohnilembus persalinus]|eukprot:KRX09430.1 hypothetical protein PPERSA_01630 [Pseudocohnilembus persalinus]
MDKIEEKIRQDEEIAEQLKNQGKYGESLDKLEELLILIENTYGKDSEPYFKSQKKLSDLCNLIAIMCLQKDKKDAALTFLKRAEVLAQNSQQCQGITYNNFACYYKKVGKVKLALIYLEKALKIDISLESKTLADTRLNMCAILSQLDRHQEALEHVLMAVINLQDEMTSLKSDKNQENYNNSSDQNNNYNSQAQDQSQTQQQNQTGNQNIQEEKQKKVQERAAVLAVAYHNMGVELEFLKRYEEAIQTYTKAVKFASENLGEEHYLYKNLTEVRQQALDQIQTIKNKEQSKKHRQQHSLGNSQKQRINRVQGLYNQEPGQKKGYSANRQSNPQNYNNNNINSNNTQMQQQNSHSNYMIDPDQQDHNNGINQYDEDVQNYDTNENLA